MALPPDYVFSKLRLNHFEFEKSVNMKKLRNLNIYATVYRMPDSIEPFKNNCQNTVCEIKQFGNPNHVFLKLLLNRK